MAQFRTLVDMIEDSVRRYAERPALGTRRSGFWEWTSYAQLGLRIARMRGGLSSLGVQAGERVAIVSDNREEWAVVACAAYGLGAQVVPMYQAQLPREWAFILRDCEPRVVFGATLPIAETLSEIAAGVPAVERVLCFDDEGGADSYQHLVSQKELDPVHPSPEDVAGFIYTSGTTGDPKGVLLTHGNIVSNINAVHEVFTFEPEDRSLSFLPWAHSFGQVGELYMLLSMGCSLAVNDQLPRLLDNLREVKPTVLFAVPRIFSKLHTSVHEQMAHKPKPVQQLFARGLELSRARLHGTPLSLTERFELGLADKLVFARIRRKFGGRLKYAISASAALNPQVAEFVQALGITVFEGYGLTETSPVVSVNHPGSAKLGTVGRPIPGVRIVVDSSVTGRPDEGEILVYGPNVMKGYYGRTEETQQTITKDGGLRTGDLGYVDDQGFLHITGRIKEQYKLESGKYVMPSPLEEQLKLSPLIDNAFLFGDNRPHNVALIVVNEHELRRRAERMGLALEGDVTTSPTARTLVQREIDECTPDFRPFERPRACALLSEDFTAENGLLTPTLKVRRKAVAERYAQKLAMLYEDGPSERAQPTAE